MNNLSKESVERLRAVLNTDLLFHQEEIRRIQRDLDSLDIGQGINEVKKVFQSKGFKLRIDPGRTFKETILDILDDGQPRTSRQLLKEFNQIKNKETKLPAFSAQLSTMAKPGDTIKIFTMVNSKIDSKYWYGLAQWFDGKNLLNEYLNKIGTVGTS
jgi:hypothetical protein